MLIKDIKNDAQSFNVDSSMFYEGGSRDTIIRDRTVLDIIIDPPCLEACKYLFDCNILTQNSSANRNDISVGKGYITIDYKSLDEHNKKVYEDLLKRGIATQYHTIYYDDTDVVQSQCFTIEVPLNGNTDSEEFSKLMLEVAKNFSPQEILYGFYTQEEIEAIAPNSLNMCVEDDDSFSYFGEYLSSRYGEEIKMSDLVKEYVKIKGYYYDEENSTYWISEELCRKAKNSRKENIL